MDVFLQQITRAIMHSRYAGAVPEHDMSESLHLTNDKFRKLFHRTFGLVLIPHDPIDFVGDRPELAEGLVGTGASDLRLDEVA